jgi:hypothetical protein
MRKLLMLAAAGVLFSSVSALMAATDKAKAKPTDDKKVEIKGDGMCAKCALKETKTCQNAVIEEKDGKKTTYYLKHEGVSKENHQKLGFCMATKDNPVKVKVTGTCEEEDGKKVVTAEKIEKVEE